jgi:hypothetical protein
MPRVPLVTKNIQQAIIELHRLTDLIRRRTAAFSDDNVTFEIA